MTTPTVTSQSAAWTAPDKSARAAKAAVTDPEYLMLYSLSFPALFFLPRSGDLHPGFLQIPPNNAARRPCLSGKKCRGQSPRHPAITILFLNILEQDRIFGLPYRGQVHNLDAQTGADGSGAEGAQNCLAIQPGSIGRHHRKIHGKGAGAAAEIAAAAGKEILEGFMQRADLGHCAGEEGRHGDWRLRSYFIMAPCRPVRSRSRSKTSPASLRPAARTALISA